MRWSRAWLGVLLVFVLTGCSVVKTTPERTALETSARWTLLPFENLAQAPQGAERIERIVSVLLRSSGVQLADYPREARKDPLLLVDDRARYQKALAWAKKQGFRYGVTGSLNEWRYKAGLDGEPAVGVTLRVVDLRSGQVVWSASGARAGWGREGVAMTAQKLLDRLLGDLPLKK
ncbi:hypothetical protein [Sulfurivirga sp.]|uniref:hypothetical protein n=1 Tax=Sulfurivirga sp. TaxID=2614236 RepID=UPI002600E767|nr:hypothetical protein [Sulfurivirga sp.]